MQRKHHGHLSQVHVDLGTKVIAIDVNPIMRPDGEPDNLELQVGTVLFADWAMP